MNVKAKLNIKVVLARLEKKRPALGAEFIHFLFREDRVDARLNVAHRRIEDEHVRPKIGLDGSRGAGRKVEHP